MYLVTKPSLLNSLDILAARASEYRKTSPRYKYVDSADLIARTHKLLHSLGMKNTDVNIIYSDSPGVKSTKHLIEFKLHDLEKDLFGTPVVPRILIWNSYNAECRLKVNIGVYRMVCSNGLTLGTDFYSQKAIHLIGEEIEEVLETFEDQIVASLDYMQDSMEKDFISLLGDRLNPYEYRRILDHMVENKIVSAKTRQGILETLVHPRREDASPTLWNFYNIINETMRERSRSQLAQEDKNQDLMTQVIAASREVA